MGALEVLASSFARAQPDAAARVLEALEPEEAVQVFETLDPEVVGPVLEHLMPQTAAAILERVSPDRTHELLLAMTPRQAASTLSHLDPRRREEALAKLPDSRAHVLRELLQYPPETAAGMMEPQVTSIAIDLTVGEAIELLRRAPRHALYYLYVTDRQRKLLGVVNIRDLLLSHPSDPLAPLVKTNLTTVPASMDREDAITLMRQGRFLALPVVDAEGRLLGVIKAEEALHTLQQEAFEDLQKMVGAGGDERALSPVSVVVRKRLPWLYVNLLTAFLASAVVGLFEDILARVTALAVLLPIVSGQGGNSGSQTLAVVIRGLALREILPGAARRLFVKELVAAVLNGTATGTAAGAAVYFWSGNAGLGIVIALAMIVNMTVAGLAATGIPLALKRLGRDPAQSSSIFLTTVTDCVGFASFLGFAVLFYPLLQ
ncbi:MAG: magnesium transporter MgtE [Candidatus Binatia bacterium]|nr:MAG: magnesium transporter MgtE [Candidatus Binatia bacterium]